MKHQHYILHQNRTHTYVLYTLFLSNEVLKNSLLFLRVIYVPENANFIDSTAFISNKCCLW